MSDPVEPELDLDAAMATTMSKYGQMKRRRRGMIGAGGVAAALLVVGGVAVLTNGGNEDVPVEVAGESITAPEDTAPETTMPTEPPVPEGYSIEVTDNLTVLSATSELPAPPVVTSMTEDADGNLVPTAVGSGMVIHNDVAVAGIEAGTHPESAIVTFECVGLDTLLLETFSYEIVGSELRNSSIISGYGVDDTCDTPLTLEIPLLEAYTPDLTPVPLVSPESTSSGLEPSAPVAIEAE